MKNSIEIRDLFINFENPYVAGGDFNLKVINLDIKSGTIVGLIGKNGAGKTTLINSILNLIKIKAGSINVLGIDNKSENFYVAKDNIGVVSDRLNIYDSFKIPEISKMMGYSYTNWSNDNFMKIINKLDVDSNKKVKEFSTGMKKKLLLAVALGHNPDLLILDEPTANLDPFAREEIIDFIFDYTRDENKTVLISSHILSDLEKICDYIVYLENGRMTLYEEKDKLLDEYAVIKVTNDEYNTFPRDKIIQEEKNQFGYELLIRGDQIPKGTRREFTSLDDIVVKLIKSKRE